MTSKSNSGGDFMPDQNNLLEGYKLLCSSYHAIDDFRAKLLGLLPLATGAGIFFLLEKSPWDKLKDRPALPPETENFFVAVGCFGFVITLGLFAYELYGIRKCASLIEAGKRMERLLEIAGGQFSSRQPTTIAIVNEPFAAGIIYPAVLAAWSFFTLNFAAPWAIPEVPITVFLAGFAGTVTFDLFLRREEKGPGASKLPQLNRDIADAEQRRDQKFFAELLSDQLLFRRASGAVVGKTEFPQDLEKPNPFAERVAEQIEVAALPAVPNRALVTLIVQARKEDGATQCFQNIRFFTHTAAGWELDAWYNHEITCP
jgi:hypothetical protein